MLTWKEQYLGRGKVLAGYRKDVQLFTIYEDMTGYQCLQGYGKFQTHFSRHISLEGAKSKAEERMTWGKL